MKRKLADSILCLGGPAAGTYAQVFADTRSYSHHVPPKWQGFRPQEGPIAPPSPPEQFQYYRADMKDAGGKSRSLFVPAGWSDIDIVTYCQERGFMTPQGAWVWPQASAEPRN